MRFQVTFGGELLQAITALNLALVIAMPLGDVRPQIGVGFGAVTTVGAEKTPAEMQLPGKFKIHVLNELMYTYCA